MLAHPDGMHVIVVARGHAYVISAETRRLVERFPGAVQHMISLPELGAIVFSDGLRFEAIRSDGVWWFSLRISWDEIRNLEVDGTILRGEASTPGATGNSWAPFTLDLMTGQCEDGIYQSEMRGAIPARRRRD